MATDMKFLASGIFMWCMTERRSNRYGSFYLDHQTFDEKHKVASFFDEKRVLALLMANVRLVVEVVEGRASGHFGDAHLGIKPSITPDGEFVELGVGRLTSGASFTGQPTLGLEPYDGRQELWLDPNILYRLHDHTVRIWAEATDAAPSPVPVCCKADKVAIANPDGETYQVKYASEGDGIEGPRPSIDSMGDGLFIVRPTPPIPGQHYPVRRRRDV